MRTRTDTFGVFMTGLILLPIVFGVVVIAAMNIKLIGFAFAGALLMYSVYGLVEAWLKERQH